MQASIFGACPNPEKIGRVMPGRASGVKNGGDDGGGSLISPDGVVPSRIVSVSASVIFHCTIKAARRFLLAAAHPVNPGKRP